jgi:hypothetical protein
MIEKKAWKRKGEDSSNITRRVINILSEAQKAVAVDSEQSTTARTNSCPVQSKMQFPILSIPVIVSLYGYSGMVVTITTSDLTVCLYTRRICLQNRQTHVKHTYGNNICFTKTNRNPMSFYNKRNISVKIAPVCFWRVSWCTEPFRETNKWRKITL